MLQVRYVIIVNNYIIKTTIIKLWTDELFCLQLSITETKNFSTETSVTTKTFCSMGLFCREIKLKNLRTEKSTAILTNKDSREKVQLIISRKVMQMNRKS